MKKILFGVAALGLLGLAGAGLGLKAQNAVETKAATDETTIYIQIEDSTIWNSWSFDASKVKVKLWNGTEGVDDVYLWQHPADIGESVISGKTYYTFSRAEYLTRTSGCVYYDDKGAWSANYTVTFTFADAPAGSNLLIVSGGSNVQTGGSPSVSWGTLDLSSTVTITKYAVVDGVADEDTSIGSDSCDKGDEYAVPAAILRDGHHFHGWYTDSACTIAYSAMDLDSDLKIYAKYTSSFDNDSYVYYVTGSSSATTNYIHTWGGEKQYLWEGNAIASIATDVTGGLHFQNVDQKIYKIPFSSTSGDSKIIIHTTSAGGSETASMKLKNGTALWWSDDTDYSNDDAGVALDFILKVEAARNDVHAGGGFAEGSICGIAPATAALLYNEYYDLDSDIKSTYIDYTTTSTYDGTNTEAYADVKFADIMAQLKDIAVAGDQTVKGVSNLQSMGNKDIEPSVVLTVVSVTLVAGLGIYFISRKRRAE